MHEPGSLFAPARRARHASGMPRNFASSLVLADNVGFERLTFAP
jgi:hypothetical protein